MTSRFAWGYAEFYLKEGRSTAGLIYVFVIPCMMLVVLFAVEMLISFHFWVFTGHERYVIDEIVQMRYPVYVVFWLYIFYIIYLWAIAYRLEKAKEIEVPQ